MHRILACVVLSVVVAACGNDGSPDPFATTRADSRAASNAALAASAATACTVAVVDRGSLVYAEAFGTIDGAGRQRATTQTKFGIGSCSKVVAAAALSLLADRQLVDLDAPLASVLPGFTMQSPEAAAITVRMLVDHSAGLPGTDYLNSVTTAPVPAYLAQALATITASRLKHEPGLLSSYANDGFTLVEAVVGTVTGVSYPEFVAREFFTPLRMDSSEFALAPSEPGSFAPAIAGGVASPQEFVNLNGSGGIRSTGPDMAAFLAMMLGNGDYRGARVLSPAAITAMGTDQDLLRGIPSFESNDGYGLGWDGVRHGAFDAIGVQVWHKNGGTPQYAAQLLAAPAWGLGVVVAGNSADFDAMALAQDVLMAALIDRGAIVERPAPLALTPRPLAPANPAAIAEAVGAYVAHDGVFRMVPDGAGLALQGWDGAAWQPFAPGLLLRTNGWWQSDAEPQFDFTFREAKGSRYLVVRSPGAGGHWLQPIVWAERTEPAGAPLSAAWSARRARQWVVTNELGVSALSFAGPATLTLAAAPDLAGYLQATCAAAGWSGLPLDASQSDAEARMFLRIPREQGRDLQDLRTFTRGGEEWLRLGGVAARPADTIATLASGAVTIAVDGFGEWRAIQPGSLWVVDGPVEARKYDASFQRLPDDAADAAYVLILGAPGAVAVVSVS